MSKIASSTCEVTLTENKTWTSAAELTPICSLQSRVGFANKTPKYLPSELTADWCTDEIFVISQIYLHGVIKLLMRFDGLTPSVRR